MAEKRHDGEKTQNRNPSNEAISQAPRAPGANHGELAQGSDLSAASQLPPSSTPLTEENLAKHNAQSKCPAAKEVYSIYLARERHALDHLRKSAYEQQWEKINPSDEDAEDVLGCFGLLSVEHVDVNLFTQPNAEAAPLGRFLADIPDGINRRIYDLATGDITVSPLAKQSSTNRLEEHASEQGG